MSYLGSSTLLPACDADRDEVDDRCDTDIDGDGFANMLGLIV